VNRGSFREFEHEGWEQLPERYHDAFHTLTTQAIGPLLDAVSASGKKLLDVASGPGYVAAAAAQRGATVTGVDFAAAMVAEATRRYPGVRFQEGDAEALPFPDASFDAVVSSLAIHNVAEAEGRERACFEIARVLRPGGRVAILDLAATGAYVLALEDFGLDDVTRSKRSFRMYPPVRVVTGRRPE
jgi:ubiquinone/menaquinone biosynthesis C-methylase UbiE